MSQHITTTTTRMSINELEAALTKATPLVNPYGVTWVAEGGEVIAQVAHVIGLSSENPFMMISHGGGDAFFAHVCVGSYITGLRTARHNKHGLPVIELLNVFQRQLERLGFVVYFKTMSRFQIKVHRLHADDTEGNHKWVLRLRDHVVAYYAMGTPGQDVFANLGDKARKAAQFQLNYRNVRVGCWLDEQFVELLSSNAKAVEQSAPCWGQWLLSTAFQMVQHYLEDKEAGKEVGKAKPAQPAASFGAQGQVLAQSVGQSAKAQPKQPQKAQKQPQGKKTPPAPAAEVPAKASASSQEETSPETKGYVVGVNLTPLKGSLGAITGVNLWDALKPVREAIQEEARDHAVEQVATAQEEAGLAIAKEIIAELEAMEDNGAVGEVVVAGLERAAQEEAHQEQVLQDAAEDALSNDTSMMKTSLFTGTDVGPANSGC